jgi:iron complex transport system substrate-binding protein
MEKAPVTLKDVYAEIAVLGKVTNKQDQAAALSKKMAKDIKAILATAKKSKGIRIYHELDDTYYSVTSDTFIGRVYKDFGVINVADAAAGADSYGYPQLSAEYLLKSDPQAIFLADAQYGVTTESVAKRAGWSQISAVKNNKVFALTADIPSRWGPRLVDFYRDIAKALAKIS